MTASVVNEKKIKIQIKEREGRSKKHAEIKRGKSRERAKEQNNRKTLWEIKLNKRKKTKDV